MRSINGFAVLVLSIGFSSIMCAQTITKGTESGVITTAVPFIRITPDARASGMADVGVSTSADAASGYHNAAKLAFCKNEYGAQLNFAPWLRQITNDIFLANVSGYKKISDNHTFGLGFRYFTLGKITYTDGNGATTNQGNPNEFAVDGSYAFKLAENFSIGASARFIYSNLSSGLQGGDASPGTAFAVDFNTFYTKPLEINGLQEANINFGVNLSNIGTKMQYTTVGQSDYLPANLALGTTFEAKFDDANKIRGTLEFNKLMVPTPVFTINGSNRVLDPNYRNLSSIGGIISSFGDHSDGIGGEIKEIITQVGVEYSYSDAFFLRGGLFYESEDAGSRNFATAGAGFKYRKMMLDFAYYIPLKQQRSPLDNQMKLSISFDLGEGNLDRF